MYNTYTIAGVTFLFPMRYIADVVPCMYESNSIM